VGGRGQLAWQGAGGNNPTNKTRVHLAWWFSIGVQDCTDTGTHQLPSSAEMGREETQRRWQPGLAAGSRSLHQRLESAGRPAAAFPPRCPSPAGQLRLRYQEVRL